MKEFKKYVKTEESKKQQINDAIKKCEESGMQIPQDILSHLAASILYHLYLVHEKPSFVFYLTIS